MNELETQIVDIENSVIEDLFNEVPEKTVNADALLGGKKIEEEIEDVELEEEDTPRKRKPVAKLKTKPVSAIEDVDLDDLEDNEEVEEEIEEEEEVQDEKSKKKQSKVKEESAKEEGASERSPVLKSTVDFLVETGVWEDFEGREELEVTDEIYAKLVAQQDQRRVESMFNELVDSTGVFGKAIINFVKSGGNPDEIIDLFKEQKQVESISIESVDGQKDLIKYYYSEVLGWKPEKIEKYISNLMLSNELEGEATEVKDLFKQHYEKETEKINREQEEFNKKQKQAEEDFNLNIRGAIKDRKDLSSSEKKLVEQYLLSYDQRLPNGNMVNKFYVNFAKMQANPADYIDLVLFVMDKQKFVQKVAVTEKSKAAAEAFKFIKGNGAVSTKKGTTHEKIKRSDSISAFDWGLPS